jgi:hypothetical protein
MCHCIIILSGRAYKKNIIMTDIGAINMILSSDDIKSIGTPGNYRIEVPAMHLHGKWEALLLNLSMAPPALAQTGMSCIVYVDFVERSPVGSTPVQAIFFELHHNVAPLYHLYIFKRSLAAYGFE